MKQKPLIAGHLGESNKTDKVGGVIYTEAIYTPRAKFAKHSHRHACFTLIRRGGYFERFGTTLINATPNLVIFRPPEETHSDVFGDSQVLCSLIEIESDWFQRIGRNVPILQAPAASHNGRIVGTTIRLCDEFRQPDDISALAIESLTLDLLAEITRQTKTAASPSAPSWLRQTKELLHDRFREKLTLSEIAQIAGVHPSYLSTAFREHCGSSVGEYMRRLRIESACRELVLTDTSLVEVALNSGFSHQPHFNNAFKRAIGISPALYRARFRDPLSHAKAFGSCKTPPV